MSGFHTHMLIGAVGGLAAFKIVDHLDPGLISFRVSILSSSYTIPPGAIGLACIVVSAYLALWPDIDEEESHISHLGSHVMWLLGATMALALAIGLTRSLVLLVLAPLVGAVAGWILGRPLLFILRIVSGGHRRLTHSLVLGIPLLMVAAILFFLNLGPLALPVFAIAWGQLLHLVGDVVTPGGVPLFFPLWTRDIHILPHQVAIFGELIIFCLALAFGVGFSLL